MNYKIYVYVISILISVFSLTGVNFEKITRKNKITEIRVLVLILGFILGYLLANFIFDFVEVTSVF